MKTVEVASKGRITVPIEIRTSREIDAGAHFQASETDQEIRLRKVGPARPLGPDDPVWTLIGAGQSGIGDVSTDHDGHLATAEVDRWRGSSET